MGWGVTAELPVNEAMQTVGVLVRQIIVAALLLLALLIFISVLVARKITKPLRQLQVAVEQVGDGKFDVVLPRIGNDEVSELTIAFKFMIKGLQELERLKDEFVFIATHELRTPVTAIRGYTEMLQDAAGALPAQLKNFVSELSKVGARLAHLINDLLEVARSQAGRLKIDTTPQNLVGLINGVLAEVTPLISEKNHIITFVPSLGNIMVMADESKLKEIITNLVSNAIKYTSTGGRIIVEIESRVADVVTTVRDNGIGMAAADQAKLFQRFYRVESSDTKGIEGTGLGLFIVRQLVEHMGGKIWVASAKGQGSAFSFSLPKA